MFAILSLGAGAISGIVICFSIVCFIVGWVVASFYFKKKSEDNPAITEDMIRDIYSQAGKKLSETQVMRIMNNLKTYKNK